MSGSIIKNVNEAIENSEIFYLTIASGPSIKSNKWYKHLDLVVKPLENEIYYEIHIARKVVSISSTIQAAIKNYNKW